MVAHRLPRIVTQLGTVLDGVVEHDGKRHTVTRWKGLLMLTQVDAFDRARPALYFVRAKLTDQVKLKRGENTGRGSEAYARWHDREHDRVGEIEWTKPATYPQGQLVLLGYRSDKWERKGRTHDYSHDFFEDGGRPPRVYTDTPTLDAAKLIYVSGGSMRITEGGIA